MPKHESSEHNLHVYKASAGSGKTHRLTEEYLRLLYSSPFAYRHILAVTFTNKATDEMKTRIVDELANLAAGRKSDYVEKLSRENKMDEASVRAQARTILVTILHDYSSFTVSTIDRFFQQTMRAFTREIGLGGGYNVELDIQSVLGEAIDMMLSDLEKKENKQLLDWLIRFSEEKVESGETWNIRNDIQSLANEIFKESYKAYSHQVREDIENRDLINDYKRMLSTLVQNFENESQEIGEKAINILVRYNLDAEDFKGGSRSVFKAFLKWANREVFEPVATFRKMAGDVSQWYTKTTDAATRTKIEDVFGELNSCVERIIHHYDHSLVYQTASEINRYFFTLGILGDIDKKIRELTAENNIMLISDTTELLSRIIEGNDSPFIYEKVGTRINNYMIDEFQDTSGMQWNNFLPLVRDSLANGDRNFIVGDVKQSIYRWRNSDWKLLDQQLDDDFRSEGVNHETLDTNWRSDKHIVNFNNFVFTQGARILQDVYNEGLDAEDKDLEPFTRRITKAYQEIYQHIPEKKKDKEGYVKIEFIDTTEHNWQDYVVENIPYQIEQLQDAGYSLKDIAILVRTKKEGAMIANRLLEYRSQNADSKYRYDIISDEALYVSSAQSIKLIVALLKYMQEPENQSLKALAVYEYLKYSNQLTAENALHDYFSESATLPQEIMDALDRIRELPLYEMTEQLFELFEDAMTGDEQIYLQTFLDMVLDFSTRKSSDLDAFLIWWNETGVGKTIFTPDGQDAIQIMTIHKSKGLGFNVVLLPFCHWDIDHKLPVTLWCRPQVDPFDKLHLVPVKYGKKLQNTIFSKKYYDERLHAFIDNLNVLYVAFTRAKNGLIAYAPLPKKDDVNNISSMLWVCVNGNQPAYEENKSFENLADYVDESSHTFEMGEPTNRNEKKAEDHSSEVEIHNLPSISYDERLKLQLKNKYYFTDSGQRDYGTLMHEVVSTIETLDDVDKVLKKHLSAGSITSEQRDEVASLLQKYLADEVVQEWYKGDYKVLNEVAILMPSGKQVRPDRVMIRGTHAVVIDYKFGELESNKYVKQVQHYVRQIEEIGYKDVEGYICYIKLGKVVSVNKKNPFDDSVQLGLF